MKWTVLEAVTKTVSKILQKVIGDVGHTIGSTFYATALIGLVQTIIGFFKAKHRKAPLIANGRNVFGAVLFGFFAVGSTILSFLVFVCGGEISVNVFIITLGIVPGALIDRFCFGHRFDLRQWLGIGLGVAAGYAILDCPSLQDLRRLPLWVWLSFGVTATVTINQGITQAIQKIDPYVKNFWGGLTTLLLGIVGIFFFERENPVTHYPVKFTVVSLVIGLVVVLMWTYNVMAYKGGAYIALKKLVLNGSYLTLALASGALIYGEKVTIFKILGFGLYCGAFVLIDTQTWKFFGQKILLRPFTTS